MLIFIISLISQTIQQQLQLRATQLNLVFIIEHNKVSSHIAPSVKIGNLASSIEGNPRSSGFDTFLHMFICVFYMLLCVSILFIYFNMFRHYSICFHTFLYISIFLHVSTYSIYIFNIFQYSPRQFLFIYIFYIVVCISMSFQMFFILYISLSLSLCIYIYTYIYIYIYICM